MKFSVNYKCPCDSGNKYKKCCQTFHKGKIPQTALELMKSRYVAYKLKNASYIIKTTHKKNKDYNNDFKLWEKQILEFCQNCSFNQLKIINFIDENFESYVTFKVNLSCKNEDNSFVEKSKFLKEDDIWKYESGIIIE